MPLHRILFSFLLLLMISPGYAQFEIPLYNGKIPNSRPVRNQEENKANKEVDSLAYKVSVPTLRVFPAQNSNGTAVIIIPGGGYGVLLTKREGSDVAREFNKHGITAIVLKYRIPSDETMLKREQGPIQDAQQAIHVVRSKAKEWGIRPDKIGVMGFSAGGHLASTAGTHFSTPYIPALKNANVRPDFMILINPVISFSDTFGHTGSKDNLLGKNPSPGNIKRFSNEMNVTSETPPAFLVHAGTDVVVPVENSLAFYQQLKKYKVPAEIHIYGKGEHGFLTYPAFDEWFGRVMQWMKSSDF